MDHHLGTIFALLLTSCPSLRFAHQGLTRLEEGSLDIVNALRIPEQLVLTGKWTSLEDIPGSVGKNVESTLALNPGLHVRYLSDAMCKEYLTNSFDRELVDIFTKEARGSFRGDICRAAVLSKEGGFYTDLDVQWLVPMRALVEESTTFMSAYGEGHDILNAVMAVEPRSEIMDLTLQHIREWYKHESHSGDWMGPATLRNALQDVVRKHCRSLLDMGLHTLANNCGPHHMRLYEQRKLNCHAVVRSEEQQACPPLRAKSHFDGVEFGLFEPGPSGKLVGWPRFADCSSWGCGGGGWDVKRPNLHK